jgi:hypothetical protein
MGARRRRQCCQPRERQRSVVGELVSTAWKNAERQAAAALGGKRLSRATNFSQRLPDVDHPLFSIEVKHRKMLPRLLRLGLAQAARYNSTKIPILVVKEKYRHGSLVVLKLADFVDLVGPLIQREGD